MQIIEKSRLDTMQENHCIERKQGKNKGGLSPSRRGILLVLEGMDAIGKTTLAQLLAEYFKGVGIPTLCTSEPTKGNIGKLIRANLRDKQVDPYVDALLFVADRMEHQHEIQEALSQAKVVICDRYAMSTIIYQSIQGISVDWLAELHKYILKPDITFILDVEDYSIIAERVKAKPYREKFEESGFLMQLFDAYKQITDLDYDFGKCVYIDASKDVGSTMQKVLEYLNKEIFSLGFGKMHWDS